MHQHLIRSMALAAIVSIALVDAKAVADTLYPDWSGAWARVRGDKYGKWDPSKPRGLGQEAPLTPEYQALYEASLADQDHGGQGANPGYRCQPHGMPRIMNANHPLVFAITPEITYIFRDIGDQSRHIYTDGRDWPANLRHTANGYSIGKWLAEDGNGRYDTLEIETRGLKNPHSYDSSGIPFHKDDAAVIKERLSIDKGNPEFMRNEVTAIDNALTRPWTVVLGYRHVRDPKWVEYVCTEDNHHAILGKEDYLVSGDGFLMPTRKDQNPPDLRYFQPPNN